MCPFAFAKTAISVPDFALPSVGTAPVPSSYAGFNPREVGETRGRTEVLGHRGLEDGFEVAAYDHAPRGLSGQGAGDAMRLVLGIVLSGSGPTVGELALRLFRFGERCAEVAAAVGFGDEQIVCAVKDERRGVEAGVACLPERLPVVGRIETLIGIVGVVASLVAEERAGGDGLHVGEADAACLVGEDGAGVARLRKEIAEGKAVVVEAEMHFELPRAFSHDETERVVMVAQLAAFAHGQAVVVVHRIVLRLQQLQPFGEVGRREFQSERRL